MGLAALLLAVGMGIGAMGAHALRAVLAAHQLESLDTAVDYQMVNALGMFMVGLLMRADASRGLRLTVMALLVGILCFSGGIYLMLAGAPHVFGVVTPVGGVLLIGSWLFLAGKLLFARRQS
jgi:uncharacterized membrane protein YgdD (TMEM256/DUF423 family)